MQIPLRELSVIVLSPFIIACSQKQATEKVTNKVFPVTQAISIDTVQYTNYVSSIQSLKNVEIRNRVKGYIESIHIDEGEKVEQGQLLFSISSQEYKEEILKAKAMLKSTIADAKAAELQLENTKMLVSKNIVSKTEQEMAEAKLDALNAKIEEAKSYEASAVLRLSFTQVKAPFGGVIDRIPNKAGSLVDEGTLLTSLSDNRDVFAYFNISEKEYLDFSFNAKDQDEKNEVSLILANNKEHNYKGKIETVEGEFDENTGSIAIRAKFPNPEKILRHGASGKLRIRKALKNVLVIPQKSTFELQDKVYVYVMQQDSTVKMRSFIPKTRIPHLYVVESGLNASDVIVYEGIQDMKEGMKISTEKIPLANIIKKLAKD